MASFEELKLKCEEARNTVIELSFLAKSAHLGSSLSCIELVTAGLQMKKDKLADKFIMSKGHAAMALYSVANVLGLLDVKHLKSYLKDDTEIWGHPSFKEKFSSFIDWSTGSLGHGLPVATGFAFSRKLDSKNSKVVCLLSDGELDEGTNWEAILFAGHHRLSNLVALLDYNKIQSYGPVNEILKLDPITDKFSSFGWNVVEVDGHDIEAITQAIRGIQEKPLLVIGHTIKSKGVPHLENTVLSHYRPAAETDLLSRRLL